MITIPEVERLRAEVKSLGGSLDQTVEELALVEAERDAARAEVERLRALLRVIQWSGKRRDLYGTKPACPLCRNSFSTSDGPRHQPGCPLATALEVTDGE